MTGFLATRQLTATYEDVKWLVEDEPYLASVVAVVALGQARHAAGVIAALEPVAPVFSTEQLRAAARATMVIEPGTPDQESARRVQRDGLIFEVLSWISLLESQSTGDFLARDPHLGSTTQGLDGLLLKLDPVTKDIIRTVVLEDKCSEKPRKTFRSKVMPGFQTHHENRRAPDLVATAAALLSGFFDPTQAVQHAAAVLDLSRRGYRASLAIESGFDASGRRSRLFNGYDALEGVAPSDLEGGGFVVGDELRPWFDQFASRVLEELSEGERDPDV